MRYRIWSNRYGAWLRPRVNGYTGSLDEAGSFSLGDAQIIMDGLGGHDEVERTDPFTGHRYRQCNEVIMAVPEMAVAS